MVLRRLSAKYPELGQKLWDEDEMSRGYVKVLKEGRDIQHLARAGYGARRDRHLEPVSPRGRRMTK